jgi:acetoin utilization deacetylase AcuC-like enzyme
LDFGFWIESSVAFINNDSHSQKRFGNSEIQNSIMHVSYTPRYYADIGEGHVFPIRKFELVRERLLGEATLAPREIVEPQPASVEDVLLVHALDYVTRLRAGALTAREGVWVCLGRRRSSDAHFWPLVGRSPPRVSRSPKASARTSRAARTTPSQTTARASASSTTLR